MGIGDQKRRRGRGGLGGKLGLQAREGLKQHGCGQIGPEHTRHRRAIGPPHPDANHMPPVIANRPSVAVAVGGAGLVSQPVLRRAGRRGEPCQNVADEPRARRGQQALALLVRGVRAPAQGQGRPAARDGGVKLHHVLQCHANAAQGDGQSRLAFRHVVAHPGFVQSGQKAGRAKGFGQGHNGDVQRLLEGLAHPERAAILAVKILRTVAGKVAGPIFDQRLRMGQPFIKGQPIDQRFQRRSGTAQRLGHIDKARAGVFGETGGTDRGKDLAGLMICHHQRDLQAVALAGHDLGRQCFERGLQAAVQRQAVGLGAGVTHARAVRQMGGKGGKGFAGGGHRLSARRMGLIGVDHPILNRPRQNPVARRCRAGDVAVRAAGFGTLRNGDQKGDFGRCQPFRFLTEIGQGCGAIAFQVAAIGGEH